MASKDSTSKPAPGAAKPAAKRAATSIKAPPAKKEVPATKPLPAVAAKQVADVPPAPGKTVVETADAMPKGAAPAVEMVEQAIDATPLRPAAAAAEGKQQTEEPTKMEDTAKKTAATAQTVITEMNDRAKTAMEKSAKMFEDMNDFAKGNVEAMVESSKIAAKGFESIGQDAVEYGRKQFEGATSVMKQFASAKSPTEFLKLQSDYMRSAFDSMVAESSKNAEAMLKLAGDVAQPLSNRAAIAADKVKMPA